MDKYKKEMKNQYKVVTPQLKYFEEGCIIIQAGAISGELFYFKQGGDIERYIPESLIKGMPEWFEKVEERITVKNLQIEGGGCSSSPWIECKICFQSETMPKYDDIKDTLELYLNGDLVEKNSPVELPMKLGGDKPKQSYEFETELTPEQFQKLAIENNFEYWTTGQMIKMHYEWMGANQELKKLQHAGVRQTEPLPTFANYINSKK